jgi:hypothetical protein
VIHQPIYDEYLRTEKQEDPACVNVLFDLILKAFEVVGESSVLIHLKLEERVVFFSHAPLFCLEVLGNVVIQEFDYRMNLRVVSALPYCLDEPAHALEKPTVLGINFSMADR